MLTPLLLEPIWSLDSEVGVFIPMTGIQVLSSGVINTLAGGDSIKGTAIGVSITSGGGGCSQKLNGVLASWLL